MSDFEDCVITGKDMLREIARLEKENQRLRDGVNAHRTDFWSTEVYRDENPAAADIALWALVENNDG